MSMSEGRGSANADCLSQSSRVVEHVGVTPGKRFESNAPKIGQN